MAQAGLNTNYVIGCLLCTILLLSYAYLLWALPLTHFTFVVQIFQIVLLGVSGPAAVPHDARKYAAGLVGLLIGLVAIQPSLPWTATPPAPKVTIPIPGSPVHPAIPADSSASDWGLVGEWSMVLFHVGLSAVNFLAVVNIPYAFEAGKRRISTRALVREALGRFSVSVLMPLGVVRRGYGVGESGEDDIGIQMENGKMRY
ncbi:unnamed protein product [Mycena citricolor]|uniref:Uncharacterized protein n=1 Tax=Mycena citricolor TaxID=2018698 RepID=A0AAD2K5W0_9AGAR|nr:unnamed protein product [Mycena citricolor]